MPSASERFVSLPGLTIPVEPYCFLLDLEARGFDVTADDDYLVIRPASRLTDTDRSALRRWKYHLLALVSYVESVQ
jgi:hypothetical protein